MSTAHLAGWVFAAAGAVLVALHVSRWLAERRVLAAFLREVVPGGRIRAREDLVRLRGAVRDRVRFDPAEEGKPRPLLRDTARTVLERGTGFCGENARLCVRLLSLGGVRAHRLYLFGARWGHVVVVHRWEGGWRVFDAHADPATLPPDEDLGRVTPDDLAGFTNSVTENPWLGSAWAKPFRGRGVLARLHPPRALATLTESPELIRALVGAGVVALGLWMALG